MNIIHVASEVQPFSTTSSISECTGSLTRRLAKAGNSVTMISPLYSSVDIEKHKIKSTGLKTWVDAGYKVYEYEIFETSLEDVKYLFFKNDELFNRVGLYGAGAFNYADNDIRFGTFAQAVMNYIKYHNISVDILHAHDWQTALIPVYKKVHYQDINCKTILTLHNVDDLGVFNKFSLENLNLPWEIYNIDFMEYYDNISFVKGGIVAADCITTVSKTFAEELLTDDCNLGLSGLFSPHAKKIESVRSGISYDRWNPNNDKFITENYSSANIAGKLGCKRAVCEELKLDSSLPIISYLSKLTQPRGIELIINSLDRFENIKANLIIVAGVSQEYHNLLRDINDKSKKIRFTKGYFKDSSRNIIASTDIVLTPSLYEPSSLMQLICIHYGSIPIARKTGDAYDGCLKAKNIGAGFIFDDYSVDSMFKAINDAIELYSSKEREEKVKLLIGIDNSWNEPTKEYITLYNKLLGGR